MDQSSWSLLRRRAWAFIKRTWPSWWGILPVSVAILLGVIGLMTACRVGFFQSFYEIWNLFALNGLSCPSAHQPANGYFVAAELLAVFVLFLAVVRFLLKPLWTWLKLWTQALFYRHSRYILVGYGALNQEIARDLAAKRIPMTIVSRSFDGAAVDFANGHQAVLLERDVRQDDGTSSLRLHRCKRVIVACGDDSLTLEVARKIGVEYDQLPDAKKRRAETGSDDPLPATKLVHAHFTSLEMHRQVLRSRDLGLGFERRFSSFSIREETAQYFVARAWLAERAWIAGHDRVHVVVAGAGDLGLAITREVLQHGVSAKLKHPPLITVLDKDGGAAKSRFKAAMPRIFDATVPAPDRPKIQFFEASVQALRFEDPEDCTAPVLECLGARDLADGENTTDPSPVTAWIVCCQNDGENLTTAMKLESAIRLGLLAPAPIYPRQWQANVTKAKQKGLGQSDPLHLVAPFGGMDDVVETLTFMNDDLEAIARSIHESYRQAREFAFDGSPLANAISKYGKPPWTGKNVPENRVALEAQYAADLRRTNLDWEDLGDEGKLQNYDPARLAALRLWELGYDWTGRHAGRLPDVEQRVLTNLESDNPAKDLDPTTNFGAIAKAEHNRWMIERALRGWTRAIDDKARSDNLRVHPNFEEFEKLGKNGRLEDSAAESAEAKTQKLKLLDAATVRGTLGGLVRPSSSDAHLARPNLGHWITDPDSTFDLNGNTSVPDKTYSITLRVPDSPVITDATAEEVENVVAPFIQKLEVGRDHVLNWIASGKASSIRLLPAGPETLDIKNREVRAILGQIMEIGYKNQVHIWLDFPDVSDARAKARPKISRD